MNYAPLISLFNQLRQKYNPLIIGIDGHSASGKTTLANFLSKKYNATVIHMDDFFLPSIYQTPEQLEKPGGNIDFNRIISEVKNPLQSNEDFFYNVFSCKEQKLTHCVNVTNISFIIIEGAYSHHPQICDLYHYKIYLHHDKHTQKKRILKRNGPQGLKLFENQWIPFEEKYFKTFGIEENANLVIDTQHWF